MTHQVSPPRDIGKYDWSDHLLDDSMECNYRHLSREMIVTTVEQGEDCTRMVDEPARRRREFEGVDVVVVLDHQSHVIITAWTEVSSTAKALASEEWSHSQIESILDSNDHYEFLEDKIARAKESG
jgi:hypothetical protein